MGPPDGREVGGAAAPPAACSQRWTTRQIHPGPYCLPPQRHLELDGRQLLFGGTRAAAATWAGWTSPVPLGERLRTLLQVSPSVMAGLTICYPARRGYTAPMTTTEGSTPTVVERVGRTWASAARDVVLIVVSILIAFGLDAWWDGRSRAEDEHEALKTLVEELRASRAELDSVIAFNLKQRRAAGYFGTLVGGVERLPHDSLIFAFDARSGGMTFDPSLGASEALVRSGLLRNAELRAQIAAWPGILQEIQADQSFILHRYEKLSDALVEAGLASEIDRFLSRPNSLDDEGTPAEEVVLRSLVGRMAAAREVRERMAALGGALDGLLYELDDVEGRLIDLQAAVESEVAAY